MTEIPELGFITCVTTLNGAAEGPRWAAAAGQVAVPNPVSMTTAEILNTGIAAVGSPSVMVPITIALSGGSPYISVTSGISAVIAGMFLAPASSADALTPNGLQIFDVNVGLEQILAGSGDAPAEWAAGWTISEIVAATTDPPLRGIYVAPADLFASGLSYLALDQWPFGTLGVQVTPSTGVTVRGYNFDSTHTMDPAAPDNGETMSNMAGQAVASVAFAFATAGTYEIGATYTSNDSNYSNATMPTSLTVEVS